MSLLDGRRLSDARMIRVITHWTAGAYTPSALDLSHYHILVHGNGDISYGTRKISDNENTGDGVYAAHTARANTGAIGVTACCMHGARESPFDAGRSPMTKKQYAVMARVVAELCQRYDIPVEPEFVLGHGEVQAILGRRQAGKWDPMKLPWDPARSVRSVGDEFRARVAEELAGLRGEAEVNARISLKILGNTIKGVTSVNEATLVPIGRMTDALGWSLTDVLDDVVLIDAGDLGVIQPTLVIDDQHYGMDDDVDAETALEHGFVDLADLADQLNLALTSDRSGVALVAPADADGFVVHVVRRGETLFGLAARFLGNGERWREILDGEGNAFTETAARRLGVGHQIRIPSGEVPDGPPPDTASAMTSPGLSYDDAVILSVVAQTWPHLRSYAEAAVPIILAACEAAGITDHAQVAYVLATAEHESRFGRYIEEIASGDAYEGRSDLGNTRPGDGRRFKGRGYVQLTGRANYRNWSNKLGIDLITHPRVVANRPDIAARIMAEGMRDGSFRRNKLSNHLAHPDQLDFYGAREIINGDKKKYLSWASTSIGEHIADRAERFYKVLV